MAWVDITAECTTDQQPGVSVTWETDRWKLVFPKPPSNMWVYFYPDEALNQPSKMRISFTDEASLSSVGGYNSDGNSTHIYVSDYTTATELDLTYADAADDLGLIVVYDKSSLFSANTVYITAIEVFQEDEPEPEPVVFPIIKNLSQYAVSMGVSGDDPVDEMRFPVSSLSISKSVVVKQTKTDGTPGFVPTISYHGYRQTINAVIPSFNYLESINDRVGGYIKADWIYQIIDGVEASEEIISVPIVGITPQQGGRNRSVTVKGEYYQDLDGATYTLDPVPVPDSVLSYIAPNQSDGRWSFRLTGPLKNDDGDFTPWLQIEHDGDTVYIGKVQYNVSPSSQSVNMSEAEILILEQVA